jgi:predicted polyphosphate/ATP-dependent NAD kinase
VFNDSPSFSLDEIVPERFVRRKVDGLVVRISGSSFNAFNDVVVGSTILSTLDGRKTQVDAELFLRGKKVESKPRKFRARIEISRGGRTLKEIAGIFGNVFVSLTGKRYLGKGIAGGAAISTFAGFKAVVACTSEGMIYRYSKEELREVEPFVTTSLSFDEDEVVKIYANEIVSRDGTPIGKGYTEVECKSELVEVLKLRPL